MKLSKNIKSKTGLWGILPKIITTQTAQCIYPYIFLPEDIYKDLISPDPKPRSIALLLHEKVHFVRQKRLGIFRWAFLYMVNSEFRFQEELLAYKEQMHYLQKSNLCLDLETRAKRLSSWLYLWCVSYERALAELQSLKSV